MIALASECLIFELADGERAVFSAEMLPLELMGRIALESDAEFVANAARAVFHFFKHYQQRQSVTIAEFAGALEKVLRKFAPGGKTPPAPVASHTRAESDLARLARDCGEGCELFFFPLLRDELRRQMQSGPRVLRFRGLRGCVKRLARARRWTDRCRTLHEQIVAFLRECLRAEPGHHEFSLVVD